MTRATRFRPSDRSRPVAAVVGRTFRRLSALVLATVAIIVPMVWMLLGSFKTSSEVVTQHLVIFPAQFNFAAYGRASELADFPRLFLNSTIVTVVGASVKLVLAITSAYGFAFVRFPFKRVIFIGVLVALMVPPQVALVPNYVLIAGLGGVNTYWGIILPGLGTAFGTFLLRQHFLTLPPELLEAAEVDGAGHFTRLTRIVVPVSTPMIATVALVTIVNEWNDYLWPLVIVNSEQHDDVAGRADLAPEHRERSRVPIRC